MRRSLEGYWRLPDKKGPDLASVEDPPALPNAAPFISICRLSYAGLGTRRLTAQHLSAAAPFSPTGNSDETVGTLLASIAFHEAYHLGQTGLSRRLLGKAGALLAPGEAGHGL